jgi:predicted dienelactone hydrolase
MGMHHRRLRISCWLVLWLVCAFAAAAQTPAGVGFAAIAIHDPVNGGTMPGYVFYPSAHAGGATRIGPYLLHATSDARPLAGAKPLVVISHGHGGSDLGHHDLAVYLASHGFVVATLEHPGDNYRDTGGTGTARVLVGRPIQVKAAISHLLGDPRWAALIDPGRIGVAGFSAGGYTALLSVGAIPRFDRFVSYCRAHPDDTGSCGTPTFIATLLRQSGQPSVRAYMDAMQKELDRWGATADPRIKAAFVMAPLGLVFGPSGLAHVDRPVFLYYGQHDQVLPPRYNALHVAPLIRTLAGIRSVPAAGHYVFLSPCSPQLTKEAPELCVDPPGVDRVAVHRQVDADALAFFRKTLGAPSR